MRLTVDSELIQKLFEYRRKTAELESVQATLEWDERTGLPEEAGDYRASQVAMLSGLIHQRNTATCYGDWINELSSKSLAGDSTSDIGCCIRKLQRDYDRYARLPQKLVEATTLATMLGQQAWSIARNQRDYSHFAQHLKAILALKREEAALLRQASGSLYDPLLDQYEEGATSQQLTQVFAKLRDELVGLRTQFGASESSPESRAMNQVPVEDQKRMSRWIAEQIGFDFRRGRLDETDHPFCTTLGPNDHRILTRYLPDRFLSSFYGTLHEAGHGMYEQGLRREWFGLPAGTAVSLGVHESQSRFWENMVGRSLAFWEWCLPHAQKLVPGILRDWSSRQIFSDVNRVEASLIRVEADEVTYNLHILIRFELEQGLLDQSISVEDLPQAWHDLYVEYLGIGPGHSAEGVLQDIHWSAGLIGYFPTYAVGNIYAAQLLDAMQRDWGDLDQRIASGDFSSIRQWLHDHIHQFGGRFRPVELMKNATGQALDSDSLIAYLQRKLQAVREL